ncbi:MAG: hypothetical protein ACE5EA_09300 [Nitrospirota bacterium]
MPELSLKHLADKKINFLKRISSYLDRLTNRDGILLCPYHHLEHTGKNVYSSVIDMRLYEITGDESYIHKAKERCLRTLETIYKNPDGQVWVFYPGMFDGRNLSDNVIDCGACVDAISSFYLQYKEGLSPGESDRFLDIIYKVSDSYLKEVVIKKPVTNRRLWGGTGLSAAYKIFKESVWRNALECSIEKSVKEQNGDGGFPYHYQFDFPGKNDVSPYYHSRHLSFIYYILGNIDPDNQILESIKDKMIKGADYLIAMINPNGIKEMNLEIKRYYWNPYYEIASNTFDIYDLVKTYELTNNPEYLEYARIGFEQILRHQNEDGGVIGSIYNNEDFKCRIFVNAQMAWLCRVIDKIPDEPVYKVNQGANKKWQVFHDSGLCRYRDEEMSVLFRYKKKPFNITWGSLIGGGSVIYFGTKRNNWENSIKPLNDSERSNGNFIFLINRFDLINGLKRFLKDNRWADIYFRLALSRIVFKTGSYINGILYPFRTILLPFFYYLNEKYTTQWAMDSMAEVNGSLVKFRSPAARQDGMVWNRAIVERVYRINQDSLEIREKAEVTQKCSAIVYILQKNASELDIETDLRYKIRKRKIIFKPVRSSSVIKIRYNIR